MARKPGENSPRNYFTKETEEYIVKYNQCTDPEEKNKIFTEHIYFPFYKLAENIIHTFKFYHTDVEQIEDLKLDVVRVLLMEKISGFDPSKGAKAFSYFGTIVKRWLIAYSNMNYAREKDKAPMESCINFLEEKENEYESAVKLTLSGFIDNWIQDVSGRLSEMFSKDQDIQIAEAILQIFRDRKNPVLEFKKKAIYVYVREITGCETPYLTKVLQRLKEDFYEKLQPLVEEGLVDLDLTT